jgi:uncharacterized membrane protein HdeD (DUF308 family)
MEKTMATNPFVQEQDLHRHWGWFLALGIITVVLGTIALFVIPIATVVAVLILGWLMVIAGIVEIVHAFRVHNWRGAALHLIAGILGFLIGLMIVTHPLAGALAWTLLFASFFTVIGAFRIITGLRLRFPHWGWTVFDGIVTLVLGIMLAVEWPWSGLWFLGLALGISMILRGWSYIMFSLAVRSFSSDIEVRRAA